MACYSPYHVHRGEDKPNGKMDIIWTGQNKGERRIDLPCGKCIGCKLRYSKDWADRCFAESTLHEENCFITLTFNRQNLPANRSLDVGHFQKFMKRLRKRYKKRIGYYHCGEYGGKLGRPHYHAILFGFDFNDKKLFSIRNQHRLYTSASLQRLWPFGFSSVGDVTYASAAYVARYVLKKQKADDDVYVDRFSGEILAREYTTCSKRPGIAARWFDRFSSDVYPLDTFVVNGVVRRPPRYFDRLLEKVDPDLLEEIKRKRLDSMPHWHELSDVRLLVKEQVKLAQISSLKRSIGDSYED